MNDKSIIDPQNLPTWTAAAFIVALLALVLALGGLYRTYMVFAATQLQLISLNKKVEDQGKRLAAVPQAPTGTPAAK